MCINNEMGVSISCAIRDAHALNSVNIKLDKARGVTVCIRTWKRACLFSHLQTENINFILYNKGKCYLFCFKKNNGDYRKTKRMHNNGLITMNPKMYLLMISRPTLIYPEP